MSYVFVTFLGFFVLIYGGGSYYAGLRLYQSFYHSSAVFPFAYWAVFIAASLTPFAARLGNSYLRGRVPQALMKTGEYWMALIYYLVLVWLSIDVLRLLARVLSPTLAKILAPSYGLGLLVLGVLTGLMVIGTYNARQTIVRSYPITIEKSVPGLTSLKAVLLSDVHLGTTIGTTRLAQLVQQVNELSPDIVFLAGDIIDGDVDYYKQKEMDRLLAQLDTRLGVYAVLGNHEYLGGNGDMAASHLREASIVVLRDEYVKVHDLFYVVGRDDRMLRRFTGRERLPLQQVMQGIDHRLPIILMDHQPFDLSDAESHKVDLQLSGHTHYGQFFPNNLITSRLFEVDWGYLKKGTLQVIVSCGYGTWGPPIRLASTSEIVVVDISFLSQ